MRSTQRRGRRGVLILVVLSLLVIFVLLATTFVLSAGQHRIAAKSASQQKLTGDPPQALLRGALMQLIRDTTNTESSIRGHSLLRDMYGNDGFVGVLARDAAALPGGLTDNRYGIGSQALTSYSDETSANFIDVRIDPHAVLQDTNGNPFSPSMLSKTSGHYEGCVFTLVTGPARGSSFRIVLYDVLFALNSADRDNPASFLPPFHMMRLAPIRVQKDTLVGEPASVDDRLGRVVPADFWGQRYVVNGRPFTGLGAGYNPTSARNDLAEPQFDQLRVVSGSPGRPDNRDLALRGMALLPNYSSRYALASTLLPLANSYVNLASATHPPSYLLGGADESYDAPDLQNMFLAYIPDNPVASIPKSLLYANTFDGTNQIRFRTRQGLIIPSFHRPADVLFMRQQFVNSSFLPLPLHRYVRNRVMQRYADESASPVRKDDIHAYSAGPWDVDNDGDGIPDSVWVDLGFPVQVDNQGQLYKPLFAFLVTDLDGRLNLNAHGSLQELDELANGPHGSQFDVQSLGLNDSSTLLTPFRGSGPAGVRLSTLFSADLLVNAPGSNLHRFNPAEALEHLLRGRGTPRSTADSNPGLTKAFGTFLPGRYGWDGVPGLGSLDFAVRLQKTKLLGFPAALFGQRYGSYMPLFDRFGMAFDPFGQPLHEVPLNPATALQDLQYEMDLSRRGTFGYDDANQRPDLQTPPAAPLAGDRPFSAAELERLLRAYDPDADQLPGRLWDLFHPSDGVTSEGFRGDSLDPNVNRIEAARRRAVTTHAYDLDVPAVKALPEMRDSGNNWDFIHHITDIFKHRILVERQNPNHPMPPVNLNPLQPENDPSILEIAATPGDLDHNEINEAVRQLISFDLLRGQRFDLNRPFGDGADGYSADGQWSPLADKNRIVDEPGERELMLPEFRNLKPLPTAGNPPPYTFSRDLGDRVSPLTNLPYSTRELFARHLYALLMVLNPPDRVVDLDKDGASTREEFAEMCAQWAVNVVDFRDPDTIMTRFEYDPDPFGTPNEPAGWNPTKVVFGLERPELLLTETLAFHDRRTEDLDGDDGEGTMTTAATGQDDDYDQRLRPRGSLFVELFNPWTGDSQSPAELYEDRSAFYMDPPIDPNDNRNPPVDRQGVILNSTTPGGSPVWRMLVTRFTELDASGVHANTENEFQPARYDSKGGSPPDESELPARLQGLAAQDEVERSIYFTNPTGSGINDDINSQTSQSERYWTDLPEIPVVMPGRYAVVGPEGDTGTTFDGAGSYTTMIGRNEVVNQTNEANLEVATTRRFVLTPSPNYETTNQVDYFHRNLDANTNLYPYNSLKAPPLSNANAQPIVAVVMNRNSEPGDAPAKTHGPNLSISEPVPSDFADEYDNRMPAGFTFDPNEGGGQGAYINSDTSILAGDQPLDEQRTDLASDATMKAAIETSGTTINLRMIHLQRLANPLRDWDPRFNPYITIDSMSVDLTTFNGVADGTQEPNFGQAANPMDFNSLQRGRRERGLPNSSDRRILWRHERPSPTPNGSLQAPSQGNAWFNNELAHTLGFLNSDWGPGLTSALTNTDTVPPQAVPNNPPLPANLPNFYAGAPDASPSKATAFAALPWNNRPFMSVYELMLVPHCRPSRLPLDYSQRMTDQPYRRTSGDNTYFRHLPNFYDAPTRTELTASGEKPPLWYRLLEFVTVPSRYFGTDTEVSMTPSPTGTGSETFQRANAGLPLFNQLSEYRIPGLVNINTVSNRVVWQAVVGHQSDDRLRRPRWEHVTASRRDNSSNLDINQPFELKILARDTADPRDLSAFSNGLMHQPVFFGNPFRTFAEAELHPMSAYQQTRESHPPGAVRDYSGGPVDATLLRQIRGERRPLFRPRDQADPPQFFVNASNSADQSYFPLDRNAAAQFSELIQQGNKVTTRSNVYAVWITVGYFEVNTRSVAGELNLDRGAIERHRIFAIIDRTIPVAFEPGEDHNASDTILVETFIE